MQFVVEKVFLTLIAAFAVPILDFDFTFTSCNICYQAIQIGDICRILQLCVTNSIEFIFVRLIQNGVVTHRI